MEPHNKKVKLTDNHGGAMRCKFFVQRKKRLCKMNAAKGNEYCPEHLNKTNVDVPESHQRVPCPLDSKHTIYRANLEKHVKICNARPKPTADYIVTGINAGSDTESPSKAPEINPTKLKLSEVGPDTLAILIEKLENAYNKFVNDGIEEVLLKHKDMSEEITRDEHGNESLRHILQTAALLGHMEHLRFAEDETTFIEFGAGKGQMSYWLSKVLSIQKRKNSQVVLIDKSSHRHKQDNKVEDKESVTRIRADIGDFCLNKFDMKNTKRIFGLGKHLCGGATDLALRCLLQSCPIPVAGFIIALCCHHRCDWKSFTGKKFLIENGFDQNDFVLMTKMTSWAICGTGYSRERRKEEEKGDEILDNIGEKVFENVGVRDFENDDKKTCENIHKMDLTNADLKHSDSELKFTRERRREIGDICKRILDYARVSFMEDNNFQCSLKYYVIRNITLENVCIIGRNKVLVE